MTPRYEHDCSGCVFVRRHGKFDVWFCGKDADGPTLVARYGSDGPDYASWALAILFRPRVVSSGAAFFACAEVAADWYQAGKIKLKFEVDMKDFEGA